jgi:hypothetical protein
MPNWNSLPPARTTPKPMDLLRTPISGKLAFICLSDDILGCSTHYWGGRTVPCEEPDCRACEAGSPTRWHGYLACFNENTSKRFILEITDTAAEAFLAFRKTYKTLRGGSFIVRRHKPIPNGRVIVAFAPLDLTKTDWPQPPDMIRILCQIWGLPPNAMESNSNFEGQPLAKPNGKVFDKVNGRLGQSRAAKPSERS